MSAIRRGTPPIQRFRMSVDRSGGSLACWPWTGAKHKGYGELRGDGFRVKAHRLAWEMENGVIPAGLFVLHRCDNPPCCNPSHLFLGTQTDNMADMKAKGRQNRIVGSGSRNPNAKLSDSQVGAIRAALQDGELQASIAARYGIHQTTVSLIKLRQSYR